MMITTQVVDTVKGAAAVRLPVELDMFITGHGWKQIGQGLTNLEGRIEDFFEAAAPGFYRLNYDAAGYDANTFFPSIAVMFEVKDPAERHHLVLTLTPFGYSTYRG